jgi:hypothetical protein
MLVEGLKTRHLSLSILKAFGQRHQLLEFTDLKIFELQIRLQLLLVIGLLIQTVMRVLHRHRKVHLQKNLLASNQDLLLRIYFDQMVFLAHLDLLLMNYLQLE